MDQKSLPCMMITELFLPTKGGTAVSFDDDYRRLGGKEVHIVTADVPDAESFDRDHPNSIHRLVLKRYTWLKPESALIYAKLFFTSLWLSATRRMKAIYAARALPEGLVAWAVARLTGRPVLTWCHGEELTTWGWNRKFKAMGFALRHADRVLANSDYTRDTLVELLGVEPERIALVYPTVDEKRFQPRAPSDELRAQIGLTENQKLVLSVGRLQRRKGFDAVIRALPTLLRQGLDVHYAVIGIGPYQEGLVEIIRQLGLEERVHLLGHVDYDDLPRWYNTCDVFAMPNREIDGDTEGFGLVFLEAASSGKPAVAGLAGGTGSAVVHEETGLRVDGDNIAEIAAALQTLLLDPTWAEKLGRAGRNRVVANFTHDRRVEELRALALDRA